MLLMVFAPSRYTRRIHNPRVVSDRHGLRSYTLLRAGGRVRLHSTMMEPPSSQARRLLRSILLPILGRATVFTRSPSPEELVEESHPTALHAKPTPPADAREQLAPGSKAR